MVVDSDYKSDGSAFGGSNPPPSNYLILILNLILILSGVAALVSLLSLNLNSKRFRDTIFVNDIVIKGLFTLKLFTDH